MYCICSKECLSDELVYFTRSALKYHFGRHLGAVLAIIISFSLTLFYNQNRWGIIGALLASELPIVISRLPRYLRRLFAGARHWNPRRRSLNRTGVSWKCDKCHIYRVLGSSIAKISGGGIVNKVIQLCVEAAIWGRHARCTSRPTDGALCLFSYGSPVVWFIYGSVTFDRVSNLEPDLICD